jgi:hypothetical protein
VRNISSCSLAMALQHDVAKNPCRPSNTQ